MLDLRHHYLVYGFPGSGNVIMQHIVRSLVSASGCTPAPTPHLSKISSDHCAKVEVIKSALGSMGFERVGVNYTQPGELGAVGWDENDDLLIVSGIPSAIFVVDPVYASHCIPSADSAASYLAGGGGLIHCVRHPLDVLLSCASKKFRYIEEMDGHAGVAAIREADLYEQFAEALSLYLTRTLELEARVPSDRLFLASYEALLRDPAETVREVAEFMGVRCPAEIVEGLAREVGHARLSIPQHFGRPATDKWRATFPKELLETARISTLLRVSSAYGVHEPSVAAPGDVAPGLVSAEWVDDLVHSHMDEFPEVHERIRTGFVRRRCMGFDLAASQARFISRFRRSLASHPVVWSRLRRRTQLEPARAADASCGPVP